MSEGSWAAVDRYIETHLLPDDPALQGALERSAAAGLPAIQVAPVQGKLLMLLARSIGARRVLEVGTLGGYSAIWLARALPEGGPRWSSTRSTRPSPSRTSSARGSRTASMCTWALRSSRSRSSRGPST